MAASQEHPSLPGVNEIIVIEAFQAPLGRVTAPDDDQRGELVLFMGSPPLGWFNSRR